MRVVFDDRGVSYELRNSDGRRVNHWGQVLDPDEIVQRECACGCGVVFLPARRDQQFVANACRQRAYRARAATG